MIYEGYLDLGAGKMMFLSLRLSFSMVFLKVSATTSSTQVENCRLWDFIIPGFGRSEVIRIYPDIVYLDPPNSPKNAEVKLQRKCINI